MSLLQHIDTVFKHKELQQQLMDAKLQRITEMMKEVEEKQQRERDFVSTCCVPVPFLYVLSSSDVKGTPPPPNTSSESVEIKA